MGHPVSARCACVVVVVEVESTQQQRRRPLSLRGQIRATSHSERIDTKAVVSKRSRAPQFMRIE